MPRYVVELKETRQYTIVVEANDEDEAYEIACDTFPEGYVSDQFDSFERQSVYEEKEKASATQISSHQ